MKLKQLLSKTELKNISRDNIPNIDINAIFYDSRKVEEGSLFVCIKGEKSDGHDFINEAVKKGAAAIIADRDTGEKNCVIVPDTRIALASICNVWYGNPLSKLRIIGITGTNGKTSLAHIIEHILVCVTGEKVGVIGTLGSHAGSVEMPLLTAPTTPEPIELFGLLAKMAEMKVSYVVMEVTSIALDQNRVNGITFETAVFTNLSQDHLDYHHTMEKYLDAKSKMFAVCNNGVINADDDSFTKLVETGTCKFLSYAVDSDSADIVAKNVRLMSDRVEFEVLQGAGIERAVVNIPGLFSVYNALAAIGTCMTLGLQMQDILEALKNVKGVKGRMEVVPLNTDYTVIIDYAHTPDALEKAIKALNAVKNGRIVCLFGCGGDRDKTKRAQMGAIAARLSDYVIVTSDNPRTEEPMKIIEDILKGMPQGKTKHIVIENRSQAIEYALKNSKKDDIILLAGKGHETYQIVGESKIHLDEREVIKSYFEKN